MPVRMGCLYNRHGLSLAAVAPRVRAGAEVRQAEHLEVCAGCDDEVLPRVSKAGALFRSKSPGGISRLLDFVLSNCTLKESRLTAVYREPVDLLAENLTAWKAKCRLSKLGPALLLIGSPSWTHIELSASLRHPM